MDKKTRKISLMELLINTESSSRKSIKNETLFKKLFANFKEARSKGLKVSFSWLYTKANVINKELSQNFKRLSKTVVVMFLRKFNIKLRRVQRKKQIDKS